MMINEILFFDMTNPTLINSFICFAVAAVLGVITSIVYMYTTPMYTKNFVITLAILPIIVQAVLILVNGNLGTSVAVLGIFSLVRFRSVPGSSKEIMSVFLTTAIGLAIGMGFVLYAILITVIVLILFVLFSLISFGERKAPEKMLKITLPENLDYTAIFDDIFEKYLKKANRERVRTTNMGTMFEVSYVIVMKDIKEEKQFIDEIRCRNGNLTVSIGRVPVNPDEL